MKEKTVEYAIESKIGNNWVHWRPVKSVKEAEEIIDDLEVKIFDYRIVKKTTEVVG